MVLFIHYKIGMHLLSSSSSSSSVWFTLTNMMACKHLSFSPFSAPSQTRCLSVPVHMKITDVPYSASVKKVFRKQECVYSCNGKVMRDDLNWRSHIWCSFPNLPIFYPSFSCLWQSCQTDLLEKENGCKARKNKTDWKACHSLSLFQEDIKMNVHRTKSLLTQ